VVYGRIHELGGIIKPVVAKMLHFVIDGVDVFAKAVHIPARPYLRPAVDGHEDEIKEAMFVTLKRKIDEAFK
jgi:phage gpG-like protein